MCSRESERCQCERPACSFCPPRVPKTWRCTILASGLHNLGGEGGPQRETLISVASFDERATTRFGYFDHEGVVRADFLSELEATSEVKTYRPLIPRRLQRSLDHIIQGWGRDIRQNRIDVVRLQHSGDISVEHGHRSRVALYVCKLSACAILRAERLRFSDEIFRCTDTCKGEKNGNEPNHLAGKELTNTKKPRWSQSNTLTGKTCSDVLLLYRCCGSKDDLKFVFYAQRSHTGFYHHPGC